MAHIGVVDGSQLPSSVMNEAVVPSEDNVALFPSSSATTTDTVHEYIVAVSSVVLHGMNVC